MFKLFNVACKWNHHLWKTLIFTGNKKRPWPAEITPQKANLCKIKVFILYCLIWQHFITLLGHTMHDQLMHCHRILPREASAGSRQNSSENHPMYTQDSHFPGYGFCPKTGYMALPCDKFILRVLLSDSCLSCCQTSDRYTERWAGYIVQADLMAELYGRRISAVLAADTYVELWTNRLT